jgi:hypothetical protein
MSNSVMYAVNRNSSSSSTSSAANCNGNAEKTALAREGKNQADNDSISIALLVQRPTYRNAICMLCAALCMQCSKRVASVDGARPVPLSSSACIYKSRPLAFR